MSSIEDSGYFSFTTNVDGSGASIDAIDSYASLRSDLMPAGGCRILSYEALTSFDVSSLPSWNFTPLRILNV